MSLAPVITADGIIAPTYEDCLVYFKNVYADIYGADVYLESDSQDGQLVAVWAKLLKDTNDAIIAAYNAFSPATAQGVGLSSIVKINGIRRLVASNSQAIVTIGGVAGTQIVNGVVEDTTGVKWNLPALVIIPPEGEIDVTATAQEAGAITAGAHSITKITTPQRNWQSVDNDAAASPGEPVESDATLRVRQSESTAIPALSVVSAIKGAILNIIGVGRAQVYENDTGAPDANGIPEHSICAVVEGGDAATVAQTIARYKTPGTGTFGDEAQIVSDGIAPPITIHFQQLALIQVYTLVLLKAFAGYAGSTGDALVASIVQWLNSLEIGEDQYLNRLYAPANLSGDAATDATGSPQALLDALSNTYNITAIYQARVDMAVEGGPYAAGDFTIDITNVDSIKGGQLCALELDNGTMHFTSVNGNPAGNTVTMAAAIPVGRTAQDGGLFFIAGDLVMSFEESAAGMTDNQTLAVS